MTKTSSFLAAWLIGGLGLIAEAQNAKSYEYTQATSPTKSGGVVTSRAQPGKPTETRVLTTTTAMIPQPIPQQPAVGNQTNTPIGSGVAGTSNFAPPTNSAASAAISTPPNFVYPYPSNSPVIPQYSSAMVASSNPVWIPGSTVGQPVWQVPTLGINNNTLLRPNISAYPVQPGFDQNAASTVPGLNIEVPGTASGAANVSTVPGTAPAIQYPQPTWPNSTAGVTPQLKLRPLINLRNLPPGTYVGQGIVGQPKAYVDGQPVRNLFRYIMP